MFLRRTTKFENPVDCVMTVLIFGKNNSPCVANYGVKKCSKNQSNNFEAKAVECVKKDFYMDDFFKSNDSEKIFANIVKRTN